MLKVCERSIPQGFHHPHLHHSTHHFLLNLLADHFPRHRDLHWDLHRDLHRDLHLDLRRSHCLLRLLQLPILLNCLQLIRQAKLLLTAPEVIELQHVIGPPFQRQAP